MYSGGGRALLVFALAAIFTLSFTISSFAISPGESVSYHLPYGTGTAVFSVTKDNIAYKGTCCDPITPCAASGTARVRNSVATNTKEAKMIYDLAYRKGWLEPANVEVSAASILGLDYETAETLGHLVIDVSQISQVGATAWRNAQINRGLLPSTCDAVLNWYNNYNVSGITVPEEFKMYYMDAGADQNFLMFGIEPRPKGFVKLKKISADTSITG